MKVFLLNFYTKVSINIPRSCFVHKTIIVISLHRQKNEEKNFRIVQRAASAAASFFDRKVNKTKVTKNGVKCKTVKCLLRRGFIETTSGKKDKSFNHLKVYIKPKCILSNINPQTEVEIKRHLLIISGDIETNPGPIGSNNFPNYVVDNKNLVVCTYNTQGLGNFKKMKRVFNKLNKLPFKNNCIINLQETHFTNKTTLPYHWKTGSVQSNGTSSSAGVAILYNSNYFDNIIETDGDGEGRFCSLTCSKEGEIFIFFNIYAPNDHYVSYDFFQRVKEKIQVSQTKYPNSNIFLSGDLNVVFNPNIDSIGRNQTKQEIKVVELLNDIKLLFNLTDCYRKINTYGGFTWGKNNPNYLRSRLDHILASKQIITHIISSSTSPFYNDSDHALVIAEFSIDPISYGPGIIRANSTLLEDPEVKQRVLVDLGAIIEDMPKNWNPHQVLDYYKYNLRIILLREGKIKSKREQSIYEQSNMEINLLKSKLEATLIQIEDQNDNGNSITHLTEQATKLKDAIRIAEEPLKILKEEESKKLIFRSKAKWAEEGEKSNKYFLNLLKMRQKKMQIRKIISNGKAAYTQDEISKAISNYYKKLYSKQNNLTVFDKNNDLFQNLPKLDEVDKQKLEKSITLDELKQTLQTCNESAPGPDGITYNTYKHTWEISGNIILNAWNYSCQVEHTSKSQKEAIITLLEKKGKDKTLINNLRPISLSNCDIKLCTKTLALRTNKVLHKLVNTTQAGYIPQRQVTNNNRLIEELIDLCHENDEQAYLITLDAQKAFDSVDHKYLIQLLRHYNFPDTYIKWICLIYNDLEASVLVNGFTTDKFKIEQSVKQGDALSCALFVLAIEPLLNKIQNCDLILPLSISHHADGTVESIDVKTIAYADDITCIVKNIDNIQMVIDSYEIFSNFSGIRLNIEKTEILVMGRKPGETSAKFNITYKGNSITIIEQDEVCICGITFSNNKTISYRKNILEKITKLERQLNIWRQRNLTLEGKILIVKTFALSQIIYSLQSTEIHAADVKHIEQIIFKFIWNKKQDSTHAIGKIKRDILMSTKDKGGLNAPNINLLDKSIKLKSLLNNIESNHPLSIIYKNKMQVHNLNLKHYSTNNISYGFFGTGNQAFKELCAKFYNDIAVISNEDEGIHKNYYAFLQNLELSKLKCFNINQQNTLQRLITHRITTLKELLDEHTNKRLNNLFLDVYQIINSIPKEWIRLLRKTQRTHPTISGQIYIGLNKWTNIKQVKLKDIKLALSIQHEIVDINEFVCAKHSILNSEIICRNPFVTLFQNIKDVKLRGIQYKILHNIYPTMKHLHRWKLANSDKCINCQTTETLKHAIWECDIAQNAIHIFTNTLKETFRDITELSLSYENVLLGLGCTSTNLTQSMNKKLIMTIDACLILLKQKLILQRDNKIFLSHDEIKNLVQDRVNLEKYNKKKRKV